MFRALITPVSVVIETNYVRFSMAQLVQLLQVLRFTHVPLRLDAFTHHSQPAFRKRRVQRHEHRACFQHSQNAADDPHRIVSEQPDHRALAGAALEQEIGEPVRVRFQLGVSDPPLAALDRRLWSKLRRRPAKQLLYALVAHFLCCYLIYHETQTSRLAAKLELSCSSSSVLVSEMVAIGFSRSAAIRASS